MCAKIQTLNNLLISNDLLYGSIKIDWSKIDQDYVVVTHFSFIYTFLIFLSFFDQFPANYKEPAA